jgi:CheY-like chemotaxis protein
MTVKLLLIEDNIQNRYLTTFLLKQHGFDVIQAETGQQGLDLAAQVLPDVILLDIQLPGIDGYSVARILKSLPHLKEIPVIAVTSYAMAGDREKCLAAGVEGYIEKPIDPDTFVEQVKAFLPPSALERTHD